MLDSCVSNEDYAKRAVELGQKVLCSVEHGTCGNYFETVLLARKYGLKSVIGCEAYWVLDRFEKDNTNNHIILLAKSEEGRQSINEILSTANEDGYYYRPRVDVNLLLSLPPKEVMVTSACIAFNGYYSEENGYTDTDNVILKLAEHFKENFYLEQQYHNFDRQKTWNKHLLELSKKWNIPIIAGLDSHYIFPEQKKIREDMLKENKIKFSDENDFYMDYPDEDEVVRRFKEQGVLSDEQIKTAMDNTDVITDFVDYSTVRLFTDEVKLPTLFPNETQEQKNKRYRHLISKLFSKYMKDKGIEKTDPRYKTYFDAVKNEIKVYEDTGMTDYPLLDYYIVKHGKELGCHMTYTGRGSAVGFLTNTLCHFSNVDRITSKIKIYPERFLSTTRILQTKSLPDIDLNVDDRNLLMKAQEDILGKDHSVPMISYNTLKSKNAFKMYARIKGVEASIANEITKAMDQYEEDLKNADNGDKDSIHIEDYVDEKYLSYLEDSKSFLGIVNGKSMAPSAVLIYQGSIRREIGLIRCKSDATKKEYICADIDGKMADTFKLLKNDLLQVNVWSLIPKIFERAGVPILTIDELIKTTENDQDTWNIYQNGICCNVNQFEGIGTQSKVKKYKPKNVSELSAFIAAIRPGFKSMYDRFEAREDFSYGIPLIDNTIRTEELPVSFILFQENVMNILNLAGIPMDRTYQAIKDISKKHTDKVLALQGEFSKGMVEKLIETGTDASEAEEITQRIWKIVSDNSRYSFNASHSYCYALDSLYMAYLKAHYTLEFYEVSMRFYTEKGNKDKVNKLIKEASDYFGINVAPFRFDTDHRDFKADKEHSQIIPSLATIKGISASVATHLWSLAQMKPKTFFDILSLVKKKKYSMAKIEPLIRIDYFHNYGNPNELYRQFKIFNDFAERKQISKTDLSRDVSDALKAINANDTGKQYKDFNWEDLVKTLINKGEKLQTSIIETMLNELGVIGDIRTVLPNTKSDYYIVVEVGGYNGKTMNCYQIKTGQLKKLKFRVKSKPLPEVGDIIHIPEIKWEKKYIPIKDEEGHTKFERSDELEEIVRDFSKISLT